MVVVVVVRRRHPVTRRRQVGRRFRCRRISLNSRGVGIGDERSKTVLRCGSREGGQSNDFQMGMLEAN